MLNLKDTQYKSIPTKLVKDRNGCEEDKKARVIYKKDTAIDNEWLLRNALLSSRSSNNASLNEEEEMLHSHNQSEIESGNILTDWDDLKSASSLSFVATEIDHKEFALLSQFNESEKNDLPTKPRSNKRCKNVTDENSKIRSCLKQQNKMLLFRNCIPKEESMAEIKEEEQFLIPTQEIDYEESFMTQRNIEDFQDNINWFKNLRTSPLYYTNLGRPYLNCPACGAIFFTSNSFEDHLHSHIYKDKDTFVCSFCNYTSTESIVLCVHLSKHKDQCEFCNANLMRKNNLKMHSDIRSLNFTMKRDHEGRFICTVCNLMFDVLPRLEKHWFRHSCRNERTYQCKECGGLYDNVETLNNHKCMKCPVCGKVYDSLPSLKAHTMCTKHNLKCPICSYEFILAMDYEKHLALHRQPYRNMKDYLHCLQSGDGKTFQCNLCDKLFYALSSLLLHLQEDHNVTNIKKEGNKTENQESITELLLHGLKTESDNFSNESDDATV